MHLGSNDEVSRFVVRMVAVWVVVIAAIQLVLDGEEGCVVLPFYLVRLERGIEDL